MEVRRSLALVLLAALLIVPAASAEDYTEILFVNEPVYSYGEMTYGNSETASPQTINSFWVSQVENFKEIRALRFYQDTGTYLSVGTTPTSFPVTFQIAGETVGNGQYGTFQSGSKSYVWIEIVNWNIGERTGGKIVDIVGSGPFSVSKITSKEAVWGEWDDPDHVIYLYYKASAKYVVSKCEIYYTNSFYNSYTISENNGIYSFNLNREYNGKIYNSYLYLADKDTVVSPGTTARGIAERYTLFAPPLQVGIQSVGSSLWYNKTYYDTAGDNPVVTVYVQNSQTGALLANAHLSIQDTTTDPWTEVVNETLSSGTGTFSLPIDAGLHLTQYRIGATVPGYQQVVPALFARVTGPTNIVVEMEPTAGGPEDPNNAYLEFYVRDIHANGIPNANVLVDGKTRWTNGQGYTQFEVAKNATYPYTVSKSGYMTIQGSSIVLDGPRYVTNVVLGPGTVPTYTPTIGPGETPGGPGATPTPDTRTNEEKGQAVIDMIADNAEGIGALALICLLLGLLKLMVKW